jgi:hypothetical protein
VLVPILAESEQPNQPDDSTVTVWNVVFAMILLAALLGAMMLWTLAFLDNGQAAPAKSRPPGQRAPTRHEQVGRRPQPDPR